MEKRSRLGRSRPAGLLVLALGMLPGCGDDDLGTRYRVSGRVTRKGEPVTKGTVNFMPVDPLTGRAASGAIQSDGTYTLTTQDPDDGALAGDYRVVVSMVDIDDSKAGRTPGGMPILNEPKKIKVKNLVSPKFSDPGQTVLKFKVEPHPTPTTSVSTGLTSSPKCHQNCHQPCVVTKLGLGYMEEDTCPDSLEITDVRRFRCLHGM